MAGEPIAHRSTSHTIRLTVLFKPVNNCLNVNKLLAVMDLFQSENCILA